MTMNTDEKFYENDNGLYFKSGYPSQWFLAPITIDNQEFNCCEQRMMYMKALTFNDKETADLIMMEKEPKEQKKLGRLVKNFDADKWDTIADEIVYEANLAKFTQHQELNEKLLTTGNKIIVECSPYDKIWGNGLDITTTLNTPEEEWKGTNRLGKAIMKVRETLRK